jgi:hypothetical protein
MMQQHVIAYVNQRGERVPYSTAYTVTQIASAVLDCEARYGYADVKPFVAAKPLPHIRPK